TERPVSKRIRAGGVSADEIALDKIVGRADADHRDADGPTRDDVAGALDGPTDGVAASCGREQDASQAVSQAPTAVGRGADPCALPRVAKGVPRDGSAARPVARNDVPRARLSTADKVVVGAGVDQDALVEIAHKLVAAGISVENERLAVDVGADIV